MRSRRHLLLGASILCGASLALSAPVASAAPVEYVKICSLYGAYFAYAPGTDTCADTSPLEYRSQSPWGALSNYIQGGANSLVYGTSGYAGGTGSSAFGDGAYAGGNPNGTDNGQINRSVYSASQYPYSDFFNSGATAVGQGAEAGASAAGEANATAIGQGASANANNATALGQGATASADNSVAIGQGSVADQADTVSFGAPGAERRLVNVAAGVMGTDAVNVDQLDAAMAAAVSQTGSTVGGNSKGLAAANAGGDEAFAGGYGATAGGQSSVALGEGANASQTGAVAIGAGAQATGDPTTAVGDMAIASGANASAFGAGATASGANSVALGQGSTAAGTGSVALGQGASAPTANSVAIGAGSVASRGAQSGYTAYGLSTPQNSAGEVSMGSPGAERQITNVAAGDQATDAVNLGQLQGAVSAANAYTDAQVDLVQRRADSGTAAAMAMAGLVSPSDPGKTVITGGVGLWRDQTALAFGMTHRFDSAWSVKAGGSFATNGGAGASAAVGYEF